ncbi:MAG: SRPBCC family protein [Candidatus Limnocylindrales bacterium]
MPAQYHFLSEYRLRGDPEALWAALADVPGWTAWWSWLKKVELLHPATGPDGLGASYRNTVRAPAGYGFVYTTEVTDVDHLRRIDLLSSGDIAGRGRFLIAPTASEEIDLRFAWLVSTPKPWMTAIAPVARPMFNWNHDRMMRAFGGGVAKAAGLELVSTRNTALPPGSPGFQVMPAAPG